VVSWLGPRDFRSSPPPVEVSSCIAQEPLFPFFAHQIWGAAQGRHGLGSAGWSGWQVRSPPCFVALGSFTLAPSRVWGMQMLGGVAWLEFCSRAPGLAAI